MLPQDPNHFTPFDSKDWIRAGSGWFEELGDMAIFPVAERVHLARLALQQQWVCDVKVDVGKQAALEGLGLYIATIESDFFIVSGSGVLADYIRFRARQLSTIEAGILYGYLPSATVAFGGVINIERNQPWPVTTGQYFLGGVYSADFSAQERAVIARQWADLARQAPGIATDAHVAFAEASERQLGKR